MMRPVSRRTALALVLASAACARTPPEPTPAPQPVVPANVLAMYAATEDGGFHVAAIDPKYLTPRNIRQEVDYWTDEAPGSIVVDPWLRFLYYILPGDRALRYGVAVGDEGRAFSGSAHIP